MKKLVKHSRMTKFGKSKKLLLLLTIITIIIIIILIIINLLFQVFVWDISEEPTKPAILSHQKCSSAIRQVSRVTVLFLGLPYCF